MNNLEHLHKFKLSLHARKMTLLILIAVFFAMDLSVLQSEYKFEKETRSPAIFAYFKREPWIEKARAMVAGTPMEEMIPYLHGKNKDTTAFVISVAKKESNWGQKAPHYADRPCYNYWGYMGHTGDETPSGYTCFSSPEEAIDTVSQRFNSLINQEDISTPQEMAVWKCGYDCSWDNETAVRKWIHDVNHYYQKFYE